MALPANGTVVFVTFGAMAGGGTTAFGGIADGIAFGNTGGTIEGIDPDPAKQIIHNT